MVVSEKAKKTVIIAASLMFVAVNTVFITLELYWFALLPVVLILLALYLTSLDKVFLLVAMLTPVSVDISIKELGSNITLPTEPLLIGMMFLLLLKYLYRNDLDRRVWFHPVTIIIILQIIWMFITSVTSEIPFVSFKYFIARLWFVIPLYFLGILIFKNTMRIRQFLILFMIPLAGVVIYTTYQHYLLGFDGSAAHWVMYPFFNDHTAYGAILAMFLPIGFAFTFDKMYNRSQRLLFLIITAIIFTGVLLSVSRAAWISLIAALLFFFILYFRIKFKTLVLGAMFFFGLILIFHNQIIQRMESNTQESEETDFAKHVRSASNITTDASNLERLNRWHAGYKMFKERPVFGWGPGTYQFVYAPYQKSGNLTIISTNFGDMGNIHSEYIGPLCDSGVLGALLKIALVVSVILITLRMLHKEVDKRKRKYLMAVFLGLSTYYVHGFLNNFLDTDKGSVPFWGFTAIIVAIDIFHTKSSTVKTATSETTDK